MTIRRAQAIYGLASAAVSRCPIWKMIWFRSGCPGMPHIQMTSRARPSTPNAICFTSLKRLKRVKCQPNWCCCLLSSPPMIRAPYRWQRPPASGNLCPPQVANMRLRRICSAMNAVMCLRQPMPRSIKRNQRAGLPADYASLRMPNETRDYVPKLQAIKRIVFNPRQYRVELADIPNRPYFSTVTVTRDMDVQVAAQLAGLSLNEFRALNPSFSKPVIVGAAQPKILLPFENAQQFEAALQSYDGALSSWTTHTVAKRMRPSELAAKMHVDPVTLISVNKIPSGRWIKPGSTLLVPRDQEGEDISADIAENAQLVFEPIISNAN